MPTAWMMQASSGLAEQRPLCSSCAHVRRQAVSWGCRGASHESHYAVKDSAGKEHAPVRPPCHAMACQQEARQDVMLLKALWQPLHCKDIQIASDGQ